MIMPMPFYIAGGLVITTGTVGVTVGDEFGGYGYISTGLGSKSSDTLVSVNGTPCSVSQLRTTTLPDNRFALNCDNNDVATAVLDYLNANFTSLRDLGTTWSVPVSELVVSSSTVTVDGGGYVSANDWDASDVGNTYTMEWF